MEKEDIMKHNEENSSKQDQIQKIIFSKEIGWQEIIYDLINTEQLDPWDINILVLTDRYLEKIRELEEADFFVSSKVLLAASLLLRIKSEILLDKYIKSIDEILFGKKEEKRHILERIELDEDIPELIPRSPIPRMKRVSLQELMESLNKAINTENRRIQKEIVNKNALRESSISLPKKTISITDKIKKIYEKLALHFNDEKNIKISYSEFIGTSKEERIISFSPLLHLENQKKVWLHQDKHFDEIHIWLKETYVKHNGDPFKDLKEELEKEIEQLDESQMERLDQTNNEFDNPLGDILEEK